MKLPKEYVILEIIPTSSNKNNGFIAQVQALKIKDNKIVNRLDLRIKEELINNKDLLKMISYDKEMFDYVNNNEIIDRLISFVDKDLLLIIDNDYTKSYLEDISNNKESIFSYLNLEYSIDIFDKIINKYNLVPSNHLVDLLYEALMYESK